MSDTQQAKVFVSHASEDKDRFVTGFATKLRAGGLDAWYDLWEIGPGDSIVKKVFTAGLDSSSIFIAVLSKISINKRWVQEELDAAVVKRIEDSARIIPVIIDDLAHDDIPLPLRMVRYVRIDDLNNYDAAIHEILQKVHGVDIKPAIGKPPAYITNTYPSVPGLNRTDIAVLKALGDHAMSVGHTSHDNPRSISPFLLQHGITSEMADTSFYVLEDHSYIDTRRGNGSPMAYLVNLTDYGLEVYLRQFYDGYSKLVRDIGLRIVNDKMDNLDQLATATNAPPMVILSVLEHFKLRGYLSVASFLQGRLNAKIFNVTPVLKRWLDTQE
jgi:hypothetical protein